MDVAARHPEDNDLLLHDIEHQLQRVADGDAVNRQIQRLVHISSLAAGGPALPDRPAREEDPSNPVSEYGKSKLAGEREVQKACKAAFVILRPPAVYGPRDEEFLRLFRAVKSHLLPKPGGAQALSTVFVKDLAEAVVTCLTHAAAAGKTYFVAAREVVTARTMAKEIAAVSFLGG
jgi:nucleoside-diphosphate-sugar epimerase